MKYCHLFHKISCSFFWVVLCVVVSFLLMPRIVLADDPCLAFKMPSESELLSGSRRVFAHYYNLFPLSTDNKPATLDYYNVRWLSPENDAYWLAQGGFLRTRPLPVYPNPSESKYKIDNLVREIKLASARGISGFTYETSHLKEIEENGDLTNMLKAASEAGGGFKIVLMADFSDIKDIITVIRAVYDSPVMYRYENRLVVAPYKSEQISSEDWVKMRQLLEQEGKSIYLILTFSSLDSSRASLYAKAADAFGMWATPFVGQGEREATQQSTAEAQNKKYMAGIGPQGYRPKTFVFWEAEGSLAYRNGWGEAIEKKPEWVQLTTWNDYSETSQVAPYTNKEGAAGTGFYNITGYYAAWYLTGKKPDITHDVLYYFYRKQPVHALARKAAKITTTALPWLPTADVIELLAFLTKPGTLVITINGKNYKKDVDAGVQSFEIPLVDGTPSFSLYRGERKEISFTGDVSISGLAGLPSGYTDLTYWTGSASADGLCRAGNLFR